MDNLWEIKLLAELIKDANSTAAFSPSRQLRVESNEMTSHKHGLVAKTVSKWLPPKSLVRVEFLPGNGHFRGRNLSQWKT